MNNINNEGILSVMETLGMRILKLESERDGLQSDCDYLRKKLNTIAGEHAKLKEQLAHDQPINEAPDTSGFITPISA
jgi:hypothetical protein